MTTSHTHAQIVEALIEKLEPIEHIHAMWEIGAAAFDRIDEWSDIDIMIAGADDKIEEIITIFEQSLEAISPIELKWRVPNPIEFGHLQAFYKLQDTSPYLLIDVVFMKSSVEEKWLVPEIHNPPHVYFDKTGVTKPEPFNSDEFLKKLKDHTAQVRARFELFEPLILKEVHRDQPIEAMGYYQNMCLRPLLELIRVAYTPTHYNFSIRYVYQELPHDVIERLEPLYYCTDIEDLRLKRDVAEILFFEIHDALDWDDISEKIKKAQQIRTS
jgi:predicted nucleotidyltransferase